MKIKCDRCRVDCSGDFWTRTERRMRVAEDDGLRCEWLEGYEVVQLCPGCQAEAPPPKGD